MREFYPPPDIHRLRDNGFAAIPIRSAWDRCNSPGKQPSISEWQRHGIALPSEEQLAHFLEKHSGGNWGIVCGDVIAIDIDILDPDLAGTAEAISRELLGDTPLFRIGKFPKRLLVYRSGEPIIGRKRHDINVEVLALNKDQKGGQQFVAFGIHPGTMKPYDWPIESPMDVHVVDLPVVYARDIDEFIAAVERLYGIDEARVNTGTPAEHYVAQPIVRDGQDLIVDGRERLLTNCVWSAFQTVADPIDPELVAGVAWERFSQEVDLSIPHEAFGRPWSYEDALQKAKAAIKRHPAGPEPRHVVAPTYPDETVPVQIAKERLEAEISTFFNEDIEKQKYQHAVYKEQLREYHERKALALEHSYLDFSGPPILKPVISRGVNIDPGVGKTHTTLNATLEYLLKARNQGESARITIAVPTHKLADELKQDLDPLIAAHGFKCATYRSRLAIDPNAKSEQCMCLEPERVKACQEIFDDVATHACGSHKNGVICPSHGQCAYQKQKHILEGADVKIVTHASLFYGAPFELFEVNPPDALIIDEDFTQKGIDDPSDLRNQIMVDALRESRFVVSSRILPPDPSDPAALPTRQKYVDMSDTADLMEISRRIHEVIAAISGSGYLTRDIFESYGVCPEDCWRAFEYELRTILRSGIQANMTIAEVKSRAARARGNVLSLKRARFFSFLGDFLSESDVKTPNIRLRKNKPIEGNIGFADVLELTRLRKIHDDWHAATLVLDATMREGIVRRYLRALPEVKSIKVDMPQAYVRQVTDTKNPNQTYVSNNAAGENTVKERLRAIDRVRRYIELQSMIFKGKGKGKGIPIPSRDQYGNETTIALDFVFICEKKVHERLLDGWIPPSNVGIDYSARIRGSNKYSGVAGIAVFGRTHVPVREVEHLAAILLGEMPNDTIHPNNRGDYHYLSEEAGIRLHDGSGIGVKRNQHPDPFVEDVRWAITEGGLLQSIGRARAVRRTSDNPVFIDILTNIPLPVVVDEVVRMKDLYLDLFDEMAMTGLLPGSDADSAKMFPELWKNAKAVKNARATRRRSEKGACYPHRGVYMGNSDPFPRGPSTRCQLKAELQNNILDSQIEYRLEGERGRSKTLFFRREEFLNDEALVSRVEAMTGKKCLLLKASRVIG